jgi:hypothetical protein
MKSLKNINKKNLQKQKENNKKNEDKRRRMKFEKNN